MNLMSTNKDPLMRLLEDIAALVSVGLIGLLVFCILKLYL